MSFGSVRNTHSHVECTDKQSYDKHLSTLSTDYYTSLQSQYSPDLDKMYKTCTHTLGISSLY